MNLAAAFDATAAADPGRVAIHLDGRTLTRGDLRHAIVDAAATLRGAWSVRRGDRVGYLGLNRVEELVLLFALARIGAVLVPLNTRLAVTELVHIATHAQLHALVTDAGHRDIGLAVVDALTSHTGDLRLRAIDALTIGRHGGDAESGAIGADRRRSNRSPPMRRCCWSTRRARPARRRARCTRMPGCSPTRPPRSRRTT